MKKLFLFLIFLFLLLLFFTSNILACELLVKTSDNIFSDKPKDKWTDTDFIKERRGNYKQGYIVAVKPEGWQWGKLELDPKRFAIIKIPDEKFNPEWLEPEYDYTKPCYKNGEFIGYEIKTRRKYCLPLEKFLTPKELSDLKSIPYNDPEIRPAIIKTIRNIDKEVVVNDYENRPPDWKTHGSAGTFTIKPSGGDYTSLNAWESGEQCDLTSSGNCIAECYAMEDTAAVDINGWTTDSTHYIKIYTPTSERHDGKWNENKYRLVVSDTICIFVEEENVRIEGLQIYLTLITNNGRHGIYFGETITGQSDHRVSHNIIRSVESSTKYNIGIAWWGSGGSNSIARAWNNIIYDFQDYTWSSGIWCEDADFTFYLYNNTIHHCRQGIYNAAGTVVAKNNIVNGSTVDDYVGTFSDSYNNVGEDETGPGTDSKQCAVTFEDENGDNFHLASNDTCAKDSWKNVYADTHISVTDDIDGDARPNDTTGDIGADEYVTAEEWIPKVWIISRKDFEKLIGAKCQLN